MIDGKAKGESAHVDLFILSYVYLMLGLVYRSQSRRQCVLKEYDKEKLSFE